MDGPGFLARSSAPPASICALGADTGSIHGTSGKLRADALGSYPIVDSPSRFDSTNAPTTSKATADHSVTSNESITTDTPVFLTSRPARISFDLTSANEALQRSESNQQAISPARGASRRPSLASIVGDENEEVAHGRIDSEVEAGGSGDAALRLAAHIAPEPSARSSDATLYGLTMHQTPCEVQQKPETTMMEGSSSQTKRRKSGFGLGAGTLPTRGTKSFDFRRGNSPSEGADRAASSSTYDYDSLRRGSAGQLRAFFMPRRKSRQGLQDASHPGKPAADRSEVVQPARVSSSFLRRASQDIKAFASVKSSRPSKAAMHVATVDVNDEDDDSSSRRPSDAQLADKAAKTQRLFETLGRSMRSSFSKARSGQKDAQHGCLDPTDESSVPVTEPDATSVANANRTFADAFGPPQRGDLDLNVREDVQQGVEQVQSDDLVRSSINPAEPTNPSRARPVSSASAACSFYSAPNSPQMGSATLLGATAPVAPRPVNESTPHALAAVDNVDPLDASSAVISAGCGAAKVEPTSARSPRMAGWAPNYTVGSEFFSSTSMPDKMSSSKKADDGLSEARVVSQGGLEDVEEREDPTAFATSMTTQDLGTNPGDEHGRLRSFSQVDGSHGIQPRTHESGASSGSGSGSTPRRSARSSRLSHLPRLNSTRGTMNSDGPGGSRNGDGHYPAGNGGNNGGGMGGSGSRGNNEDDPSDNDTGDEADPNDADSGSETGSDASLESEEDEGESGEVMPGSFASDRRGSRASRDETISATRVSQRPTGITLPPTPAFGEAPVATPTPTQDTVMSAAAIGRNTWTTFNAQSPAGTPGWFSTPMAGPSTVNASVPGDTSKATSPSASAQSPRHTSIAVPAAASVQPGNNEPSYFNIRPAPGANVLGNRDGSGMPPPSPSIITRSRAQSSANVRISRGAPLPSTSREMPPILPMIPLSVRHSQRSLGTRARSPNRKATDPIRTQTPPSIEAQSLETTAMPQQAPIFGPITSPDVSTDIQTTKTISRPSSRAASRPSLYAQQSRSLIDLSSSVRKQLEPQVGLLQPQTGLQTPALDEAQSTRESQSQQPLGVPDVPTKDTNLDSTQSPVPSMSGLRRRRSMYEVGAAPPPYTSVHKASDGFRAISPREEEGHEYLPSYWCSVHIEGYLPRKMEFSSPGVQAKDRSWRRMYFVLHGTSLRVYRTDLSNDKQAERGMYGAMEGAHVHREPMSEDGPSLADTHSTFAASTDQQRRGSEDRNAYSADGGSSEKVPLPARNGPLSTSNGQHQGRRGSASHGHSRGGSISGSNGGGGGGGIAAAVESALTGTISHMPFSGSKGHLVKQYTLQGAESGLAADYLKRRHVVRVRAEGEQFLLQTRNDRHVVDWIEAFQASTNIALDLERRPMPKFITLPRRRRRRRRDGAAAAATGASASATGAGTIPEDASPEAREAAELAEAQRRSLADVGASGSGRANGSPLAHARESTTVPRTSGLHGSRGDEQEPDPSAAFERMLREEEEDSSRGRDVGDMM